MPDRFQRLQSEVEGTGRAASELEASAKGDPGVGRGITMTIYCTNAVKVAKSGGEWNDEDCEAE
jgi:hypothetical protein